MKLVEIYLPCRKSNGNEIEPEEFDRVEQTLTEKFGGVTAYRRTPAIGRWKRSECEVEVDDVAVIEVITDELDRHWWNGYQRELLLRFQQDELLIRVSDVELLQGDDPS